MINKIANNDQYRQYIYMYIRVYIYTNNETNNRIIIIRRITITRDKNIIINYVINFCNCVRDNLLQTQRVWSCK